MIYLDHNATTPPAPEVLEAMEPLLRTHYANPSSASLAARPVRKAITRAREECAALLGCEPEELIFTSGGTEALNAALFSLTVLQPERKHLVIGSTEHEAVMNPAAWLERERGYEVTRLPVEAGGRVSLAALAEAIRPGQTAVVALMLANNETGVRHPVEQAAALAAAQGVPFLADGVQAAGKVPVNLRDLGAQMAAFSAHKFHGPKGAGLLYVRSSTAFQPWMLGGAQEQGRRAGTENPAAAAGMGAAARLAREALDREAAEAGSETEPRADSLAARRDQFERAVLARIPGSHRNGDATYRVPNTSSLRFDGTQAEGLLMLLEQRGICASAGSACTAGSLHPSHVLTAMGLDAAQAKSTVRFSLARSTTVEELEQAVKALEQAVARFRAMVGS